MFLAALASRSCMVWHTGQHQIRILSGSVSRMCPHVEHVLLDGSQRSANARTAPTQHPRWPAPGVDCGPCPRCSGPPRRPLGLVTELGTDGRSRDHRTRTSPTFARYNRPSGRTLKPLRVSRKDCRVSLRDVNLGLPTFRPRRLPFTELKKFWYARCASRTDCTSATLATPGLGLGDHPPLHLGRRQRCARPAGLFPTSDHVVEHHASTPERTRQLSALNQVRFNPVAVSGQHQPITSSTGSTQTSAPVILRARNCQTRLS